MDHDGYLPVFVRVTNARHHDSKTVKMLRLPKGSIALFGKTYIKYSWFRTLRASGLFFVTRLRTNAVYKVLKRNPVRKSTGVTSDHVVVVSSQDKELRLRRVGYRDQKAGKFYEFLINHFDFSAKTIADIYKERWQIETFFRLIKQNLRLKSFVGTSENAVLSQIHVTMIAYLIPAWLKFKSSIAFSLQQMFQLLQVNLFDRRKMEDIFKPPDAIHYNFKNDYRLLSYTA
ncbi:MAG: IS4 family transposase [Pseudodesulfovibrio sp.]